MPIKNYCSVPSYLCNFSSLFRVSKNKFPAFVYFYWPRENWSKRWEGKKKLRKNYKILMNTSTCTLWSSRSAAHNLSITKPKNLSNCLMFRWSENIGISHCQSRSILVVFAYVMKNRRHSKLAQTTWSAILSLCYKVLEISSARRV